MNAILFAAIVMVQTPIVKLVTLPQMHTFCGSAAEFDACSVFVSYHLTARCTDRKIEALATFRPMIFIHNIERLDHEQQHVEDIRTFAAAYVTDIEQKEYESESQCAAAARRAEVTFGERMKEFAARSMRHIR